VQRTMRPRMLFFRGWNRGALRRAVGRAGRAAVAITRVETFLFMGASYSLAGGCRTGSPLSTSCELHYIFHTLRNNQELTPLRRLKYPHAPNGPEASDGPGGTPEAPHRLRDLGRDLVPGQPPGEAQGSVPAQMVFWRPGRVLCPLPDD